MNMRVLCPEGHPVLVDASRLGGAAICPRCFASFLVEMGYTSSRQARKEDSKTRRSRDDDDDDEDDEEEERPRKKTKARKAKDEEDDEEEEKSRRNKQSRTKDAEDEEEDEEDAEKGEPEEPIEWTPRKRQLNICSNGLIAMQVACYLLIAFTIFTSLWIDLYEFNLFDGGRPLTIALFNWFSLPLGYLGLTAFVVGVAFNLAVPGKAEAKGGLIAALVFAGLVYLLGLLALLTMLGALVSDPARAERFVQLLAGASIVCFILCMVSTMAYLAKLMNFMKLHLDSSKSISNIGFILLALAILLGLVLASPILKNAVGEWMGYVVAVAALAVTGYAVYMWFVHASLIIKVRLTIGKYVKEG